MRGGVWGLVAFAPVLVNLRGLATATALSLTISPQLSALQLSALTAVKLSAVSSRQLTQLSHQLATAVSSPAEQLTDNSQALS